MNNRFRRLGRVRNCRCAAGQSGRRSRSRKGARRLPEPVRGQPQGYGAGAAGQTVEATPSTEATPGTELPGPLCDQRRGYADFDRPEARHRAGHRAGSDRRAGAPRSWCRHLSGKPLDDILDLQFIATMPQQSQKAEGFVPIGAIFPAGAGQPSSRASACAPPRMRSRSSRCRAAIRRRSTSMTARTASARNSSNKGRRKPGQQGVVRQEDLPKVLRWIIPSPRHQGHHPQPEPAQPDPRATTTRSSRPTGNSRQRRSLSCPDRPAAWIGAAAGAACCDVMALLDAAVVLVILLGCSTPLACLFARSCRSATAAARSSSLSSSSSRC